MGPLQGLGDQLGLLEDHAQVCPDQLVELGGGNKPRRAAACPAGAYLGLLSGAAVIPVAGVGGGAGDPAAAQVADAAADQPAQQVGMGGVAAGLAPGSGQPPPHQLGPPR